jgi:hypothetical protein
MVKWLENRYTNNKDIKIRLDINSNAIDDSTQEFSIFMRQ